MFSKCLSRHEEERNWINRYRSQQSRRISSEDSRRAGVENDVEEERGRENESKENEYDSAIGKVSDQQRRSYCNYYSGYMHR
jgi:DNA-directed RNA polymerase specialized sigma24 family protein